MFLSFENSILKLFAKNKPTIFKKFLLLLVFSYPKHLVNIGYRDLIRDQNLNVEFSCGFYYVIFVGSKQFVTLEVHEALY